MGPHAYTQEIQQQVIPDTSCTIFHVEYATKKAPACFQRKKNLLLPIRPDAAGLHKQINCGPTATIILKQQSLASPPSDRVRSHFDAQQSVGARINKQPHLIQIRFSSLFSNALSYNHSAQFRLQSTHKTKYTQQQKKWTRISPS